MAGGVMLGGVLPLAGGNSHRCAPCRSCRALVFSPAAIRATWDEAGVRRILALMGPQALLGVRGRGANFADDQHPVASYVAPGSVTWLFYADRLMEFPTALLGVALGVVLTPGWPLPKLRAMTSVTPICWTGVCVWSCSCWLCLVPWACSRLQHR